MQGSIERGLDTGDVEMAQQATQVVEVVELRTDRHRQAVHGQQVIRSRHPDPRLADFQKRIEAAVLAETALRPGVACACCLFSRGFRLRGAAGVYLVTFASV